MAAVRSRSLRARGRTGQAGASVCIGGYLVSRLKEYGVRHIFGIPGDYVLRFCHHLQDSGMAMVGTAKEDGAGFAADAYARVSGMGALYVTYCVGGLSVANAVAGAYAEKSPVVVISGAPGMNERINDPLLHHKVKTFNTQKEIFERLTVCAVVLDDAQSAFQRIDEALRACWTLKRPVYIELPRDMVDVVPRQPYQSAAVAEPVSHAAALSEAVAEAVAALARAKRPVILADVEIHRFGLGIELTELVARSGIPVAVTILGKSVIGEGDPSFIGVYEGAMGHPEVRRQVEDSDCLLMLGTVLTDVNLGVFTASLERSRIIEATSEKIQVRHHRWEGVRLGDFLRALIKAPLAKRRVVRRRPKPPIAPAGEARMTAERLFQLINVRLQDRMAVVCDVGLCLFGAIDLVIQRKTEFLALPATPRWASASPASIGLGAGQPRAASGGAGRRWGLPNDRQRALNHRPAGARSDRGGVQQLRLYHRALHR